MKFAAIFLSLFFTFAIHAQEKVTKEASDFYYKLVKQDDISEKERLQLWKYKAQLENMCHQLQANSCLVAAKLLYLIGQEDTNPKAGLKGILLLKKALILDPNNAEAIEFLAFSLLKIKNHTFSRTIAKALDSEAKQMKAGKFILDDELYLAKMECQRLQTKRKYCKELDGKF